MRTVEELMTGKPLDIDYERPVIEAARLMRDADVGAVPVTKSGVVVGVLTDHDVTVRLVAAGIDPRTVRTGEVASEDPVTAEPGEDVDVVLRRMSHHRVRRLPVVDDEGRLVGLLAREDLARAERETAGRMARR